ncbi:bifunctional riboflavin kinase/FAD synthetase [Neoactinobaculum massilliense]|uniref:bifunctional riboflavin kinase/FAD synthetase n=1 Tax=Neoactinobaculum massilliense TaxID=2364794 RepID=UPI000F53B36E|nr:bifunctional riboflavin kinase/FAD synthetase [Neoactinobaculum massilliense]
MQVWRAPEDIPEQLGGTVVTVGVFDGVHRGHQAVLGRVVELARQRGLTSVVLTFDPHPSAVHNPSHPAHLIGTLEDRLNRIEALGVDAVFVQQYTLEYAQASPAEFVEGQLIGQLHARAIVVGEDVRFGCANTGDGAFLRAEGRRLGVSVELIPDQFGADGHRWSSTRVRECLAAGDMAGAQAVLGRAHRIVGVVSHGARRGRELGFPTANLEGPDLGEVPADGVYAGWLVREVPGTEAAEYLPAAISVGTNPQFNGVTRTVEAHVLGRADLHLYGERVAIDFVERIRPMLTFASVEELLHRMDQDLRETARILGVPVSRRVNPRDVTA